MFLLRTQRSVSSISFPRDQSQRFNNSRVSFLTQAFNVTNFQVPGCELGTPGFPRCRARLMPSRLAAEKEDMSLVKWNYTYSRITSLYGPARLSLSETIGGSLQAGLDWTGPGRAGQH